MEEGKSRGAFADNLRGLRSKARLTQKGLGERVGVDEASVSNWENGIYMPSLRVTIKLADALNCSLDELTGRNAPGEYSPMRAGVA